MGTRSGISICLPDSNIPGNGGEVQATDTKGARQAQRYYQVRSLWQRARTQYKAAATFEYAVRSRLL